MSNGDTDLEKDITREEILNNDKDPMEALNELKLAEQKDTLEVEEEIIDDGPKEDIVDKAVEEETAEASDDTSDYLPSSWEMNKVTTPDQTVAFSFEDIEGKTVQLTDERFKNKPVLINLFGTWCPNCNDEAPVLAKFYDQYKPQGIEMVGLAFEFTEDPIRDRVQLSAFKKRHKINYPLLLAGGNDKTEATKILGFLDEVKSYPTTLFLDKNHKVVKINTGFSGPGTGDHYIELVNELESEIQNLLAGPME